MEGKRAQRLIPKGQWWVVFHDDELNALEKESLDANQTIKVAAARLEQARATAAVQISTLFPTVGLQFRERRRPLSGSGFRKSADAPAYHYQRPVRRIRPRCRSW